MPPKQKHQPQRTCIACRQVTHKRDLIRVVRNANQRVVIDTTGKLAGRGAYLCKKIGCWQKASDKNLLAYALKIEISDEDKAQLIKFAENLV